MENILTALGAEAVPDALMHRCCGSFLSATDPEIVTPLVKEIIGSAVAAKADCLVTACARCQLNLEIRNTNRARFPFFTFLKSWPWLWGPTITRSGSSGIWWTRAR
jgi:heterodisulfide reductase subunit B2